MRLSGNISYSNQVSTSTQLPTSAFGKCSVRKKEIETGSEFYFSA
jgi:hypothetical protein